MNFLKKLFSKPKSGYYCVIDWTEEAREYAIGYDFVKQINHFHNGGFIKTEPYTSPSIRRLVLQKVPMVDLTYGQAIPKESIVIPKIPGSVGSIQLHARLPEEVD